MAVHYDDRQRVATSALAAVVGVVGACVVGTAALAVGLGTVALYGAAAPLAGAVGLAYALELRVRVVDDAVEYRLRPLHRWPRRIPITDVVAVEHDDRPAWRQYWGYGYGEHRLASAPCDVRPFGAELRYLIRGHEVVTVRRSGGAPVVITVADRAAFVETVRGQLRSYGRRPDERRTAEPAPDTTTPRAAAD